MTKEIDRIVERGPSFLGEGPSFLADRTSGELEPVSVQWASRVSLAVDKREKERERERERVLSCRTFNRVFLRARGVQRGFPLRRERS